MAGGIRTVAGKSGYALSVSTQYGHIEYLMTMSL